MLGASLVSCSKKQDATESKIDELISKMTLTEKIGQMNQLTGEGASANMKDQIRAGVVGSILNEVDANTINELQRVAVEESRLGIPLIFARDVIHGFKTIFPIPLGQAATWNPELAEQGARIAAQEASSVGIRWTFAPMVDVSRDPRWGRIAESCGEDPYLTSVMGVAMVKGFQGDNLADSNSIAACAKHFAGYGASESGKDYNTTWIPETQLRDVYLPSFHAVADAGVATFMCSFNDINGIPSSGNKHLNKDILRNEWKWDGVLVSDWGSIDQMISHGVCANSEDAAIMAVDAGVDADMMGFVYIKNLEKLVKEGKVDEKLIDNAVRNILRLKFRLGLFENPYVKDTSKVAFYASGSLNAARQAAEESAVLLKNNNVLPISTKTVKSIAVVGPMSDAPADQLGTWVFDAEPSHSVTPLQAIRQDYGSKFNILAEKGLLYSRDTNSKGIARAVQVAEKADIVLFFAGEEAILSGEAHCRADISLPGAQTEMLRELKKTGKPVVTVLMTGRPNTISEEVEKSDAFIYAFQGGTMAGPALADLLFGNAVPSGKLPVTIPRMVGQVPVYYAHKMTGRPASNIVMINDIPVGAFQTSLGNTSYHLDAGDSPLFPFGYGLSYTTFSYSPVHLSATSMDQNGKIMAECKVTNTGKYDAREVIQLYIRDKVATLAQPVRELKGFKKIMLKAGESQTISFEINACELGFWHQDNTYSVEPGEFQVWISKDSQSGEPVSFYLK
ncbi:MAG: glycoside hydrolase family 3 N-terminal domain-containing protein [Paludibacter sp.]|nr:glycoside hydrolase family 3 N-terminal domain-containing protein [Paludibacter sp.]